MVPVALGGRRSRSWPSLAVWLLALLCVAPLISGCGTGGQQVQISQPPPPPTPPTAPPPVNVPPPVAPSAAIPQPPDDRLVQVDPSAVARQQVRIALLLPLTGPQAQVGAALRDAALMALFEVGNDTLILQLYDTSGTGPGADSAARTAVDQGAQVILGPLFADAVRAVSPVAAGSNVPVIAFSSDATVAGNGVYLISVLLQTQIDRIVRHSISQGLERFAVLAPDDPYGRAAAEAMRTATAETSSILAAVRFFDPASGQATQAVGELGGMQRPRLEILRQRQELEGGSDPTAEALRARLDAQAFALGQGFDAILLPTTAVGAPRIASQLANAGVDPRLTRYLGTIRWNTPSLGQEPALVGAWLPMTSRDGVQFFRDRFVQNFGTAPPDIAGLAYDAVALVAVLAGAPGGPDFSAAALTRPGGFDGVNGIFRLGADGLAERGLAVMEITPDGLVEVAPAPRRFDAVAF